MENWLTRLVATLCAAGSTALFWLFGVFVSGPWRDGRIFALNKAEFQLIAVPLIVGSAVAWGALHLFALADLEKNPRIYATTRALLVVAIIAAAVGGAFWAQQQTA